MLCFYCTLISIFQIFSNFPEFISIFNNILILLYIDARLNIMWHERFKKKKPLRFLTYQKYYLFNYILIISVIFFIISHYKFLHYCVCKNPFMIETKTSKMINNIQQYSYVIMLPYMESNFLMVDEIRSLSRLQTNIWVSTINIRTLFSHYSTMQISHFVEPNILYTWCRCCRGVRGACFSP